MNKVVREHYPAANLPADLREGISEDARVTVMISVEPIDKKKPLGWYERFKHIERSNYGSTEEVDAYVRSIRDEWSHRER